MRKLLVFFLTLLLLSLTFPIIVNADVGPKPTIKIIVKNPPENEYYLDLLIDYDDDNSYENIREEDSYSQEMYNLLKNYNVGGWRPALVTGTRVPLHGKLTGHKNGNNMIHKFSYVGVPDKFKIIIVTSDSETIVSENIVERKAFNSTVYYDLNKNKLSESSIVIAYLLQFIVTCSITLIMEGLILILFGFNLKKNWKPFVAINLLTQILLTIVIFTTMYTRGSLIAILFYIPFELVILVIEAILFAKCLIGHTKSRRVGFAITANMISFVLGFAAMIFLPEI